MKITQKKLRKLLFNIFKKYKFSNEHAKISTEAIIKAELINASSHGLSRLKMYCDRIKKKLINSNPKIKIKKKRSKPETFVNMR